MKIVNSDDIYEKDLEVGLDIGKPEDIFSDEGQAIRLRSKAKTKARQSGWVDGRLGIIIDGTGKDVVKISRQKALLDQLGYQCAMILQTLHWKLHRYEIKKESKNSTREVCRTNVEWCTKKYWCISTVVWF